MSGAPIDRLDARAADDAAADGADFDAAALDSWADKIQELYTADAEQPYALALQEVIVAFFATTDFRHSIILLEPHERVDWNGYRVWRAASG